MMKPMKIAFALTLGLAGLGCGGDDEASKGPDAGDDTTADAGDNGTADAANVSRSLSS